MQRLAFSNWQQLAFYLTTCFTRIFANTLHPFSVPYTIEYFFQSEICHFSHTIDKRSCIIKNAPVQNAFIAFFT